MKVRREWFFLAAAVFLFLATTGGPVQAKYPEKTVEMIVSYPAGGGQDVCFRILAKHAEKYMGQKIVVLNKVGGGGVIGNTEIARSRPDGYTLGTIGTSIVTDEFIIKGVSYTRKNFIRTKETSLCSTTALRTCIQST